MVVWFEEELQGGQGSMREEPADEGEFALIRTSNDASQRSCEASKASLRWPAASLLGHQGLVRFAHPTRTLYYGYSGVPSVPLPLGAAHAEICTDKRGEFRVFNTTVDLFVALNDFGFSALKDKPRVYNCAKARVCSANEAL